MTLDLPLRMVGACRIEVIRLQDHVQQVGRLMFSVRTTVTGRVLARWDLTSFEALDTEIRLGICGYSRDTNTSKQLSKTPRSNNTVL